MLTQELINVHDSPCSFHQESSIIKMELVVLKSFAVDQIHVVRKKNHETPEAKDLKKFLTDRVGYLTSNF